MRTENTKLLLVVVGAVIIGYLIYSYNKKSTESFVDLEGGNYPEIGPPSDVTRTGYGAYATNNPNDLSGSEQSKLDYQNPNVAQLSRSQNNVSEPSGNIPCGAPKPSEPLGDNEVYTSVANYDANQDGPTGLSNNQYPKDCFPKDQLSPAELLPGDANSTWAQVNPAGQGSLGDQNFLNAGFHVGVNTVGQTMRNANLQLRSEPPNPQVKVSPWLQSTIEPDTNRKPMEIGGC